jgi:hypothetical protein
MVKHCARGALCSANCSRSPKVLQTIMDKKRRATGTDKSAKVRGKASSAKGSTPRTRKPSASLAAPAAMGGIIGGGGYDFQTRFIACHIPEWLAQNTFTQVFHEGTGDVDVEFGNSRRHEREHIQVKDHEVKTKGEFKKVIEAFVGFDQRMLDAYKRFTLACPSLGPEINRLRLGLERLRQGAGFFGGNQAALRDTLDDVKDRISKLGLARHEQFILDKLYFQLGPVDYHHDGASCDAFIGSLLKNPAYSGKLHDAVRPAYSALLREVNAARGKTLDRVTIQRLIEQSLKDVAESSEAGINLDVHTWTFEKYDREADYVVDWSALFERETRKVPKMEVWNEELLPELYALKKRLLKETGIRLIRLRGKNALTTGVALGAAFPQNGGWVFEIPQPPLPAPWRSDAVSVAKYPLKAEETLGNPRGDSIAYVFNIKGNALRDVREYISRSSLSVKAVIAVEPADSPGALSIADDREAVSLALGARDEMYKALTRHDVRMTHLFFFGPLALSVFVGQLLTAIGRVQLYEFQDPGYVPTATLRT